MKQNLLILVLVLHGAFSVAFATTSDIPAVDNSGGGNPVTPLVINQFDSVYFDIALATVNGTTVDFPVYFRSDDVINALDFEFKYDHSHLEYDTILNLTSYIEPLAYYNTNDSTVRLTSYSFTQAYSNDTPLVVIRFNLLSGQLCATDIYAVGALLNGDAASYMVTDCQTIGISEIEASFSISVYPNPASEVVTISVTEKAEIEIMDIRSGKVVKEIIAEAGNATLIHTSEIQNGIYILKVTGRNFETFEKLVISK